MKAKDKFKKSYGDLRKGVVFSKQNMVDFAESYANENIISISNDLSECIKENKELKEALRELSDAVTNYNPDDITDELDYALEQADKLLLKTN